MARSSARAQAAAEPRPTTEYVILRRLASGSVRVDELPPDLGDEHQAAYVPVGVEHARSDDAAIDAYRAAWAAEHDGVELGGAFRAVAARAWKGLVEYEAPAHVPMQRKLTDA